MLCNLLLLGFFTALVAGTENCTIGTSVPAGDGCNTCECMDNGILANCTAIDCKAEQAMNESKTSVAAQRCDDPGSAILADDGCNYCNCTEDGTIGECTSNDCEINRSALLKILFSVKRCTSGTELAAGDGCNKCFCTHQGIVGSCSIRDCQSEVKEDKN